MTPGQLREERDARGLSRAQFGKLIGMTPSKIARMETRGFLSDGERDAVLNLLESLTVVDTVLDETEEDPTAWVVEAKVGDWLNVHIKGKWYTNRYRFKEYKPSVSGGFINVIDQRNGSMRSFSPTNVRPQAQTTD